MFRSHHPGWHLIAAALLLGGLASPCVEGAPPRRPVTPVRPAHPARAVRPYPYLYPRWQPRPWVYYRTYHPWSPYYRAYWYRRWSAVPAPAWYAIPAPYPVPVVVAYPVPMPVSPYGVTTVPADPPAPAVTSPATLGEDDARRGLIRVVLPRADALLLVDGREVPGAGTERFLRTPPLLPGRQYAYRISAAGTVDGRPLTWSRTAVVEAGAAVVVDFNQPAAPGER